MYSDYNSECGYCKIGDANPQRCMACRVRVWGRAFAHWDLSFKPKDDNFEEMEQALEYLNNTPGLDAYNRAEELRLRMINEYGYNFGYVRCEHVRKYKQKHGTHPDLNEIDF